MAHPRNALLRALQHLKAAFAPDAFHALMVDGLAICPPQSMSAADAEAWVLVFELYKFRRERRVLIRFYFVTHRRAYRRH